MTEIVETIEPPPTIQPAETPIPPTEPQGDKPAEGEKPVEPNPEAQKQEQKREEMRELARAKTRERQANDRAQRAERERADLETARKGDLERVRAAEELAARFKDPKQALKALEDAGLSARDIIRASFEAGTPEEMAEKLEALAEKKARAMLDEYKKEQEKERVESQKQSQAQRDERDRAEAAKWFQGFITERAEKYPATAKLLNAMPDYAMNHAFRVYAAAADQIDRAKRLGREISYSDDECADALEKVLAPMYSKIIGQSNSSPKPKPQDEANGAVNGSAAAISVTGAQAGALGSMGDLPKDFRNWSPDKQNEYWIQQAEKQLGRGTRPAGT
jgi:hypothetical protein